MKTYEEMAASVFARCAQDREKKKRRNRVVTAALCLTLAAGSAVFWLNQPKDTPVILETIDVVRTQPNEQTANTAAMRPVAESSERGSGAEEFSGAVAESSSIESNTAGQFGLSWPVGEENPEVPMTTMISYYEISSPAKASYKTPENGSVGYSEPLREAMEHYGNTTEVQYRIVIDLFADGKQLDPNSDEAFAEIDRLGKMGCRTGLERYYQDNVLTGAAMTLHACYDEIKSLPVSDGYGYMLFLHDERFSSDMPADAVVVDGDPHTPAPQYSQPAQPSGQGTGVTVLPYIVHPDDLPDDLRPVYGGQFLDANRTYVLLLTEDTAETRQELCDYLGVSQENVVFHRVAYSYDYLTALQKKISGAMAAGELPSVVSSAIDDSANQIVLQFVTPSEQETDPSELELVRSFDTQGGAIEFRYGGEPVTEE